MAEVTGMTAAAIDALMDDMIVSADIDENGQMIFTKRGGETVNAGPIVPPAIAVEQSWPVGSVFISANTLSPADTLGIGEWVRYAQGRMLVSQLDGDTDFDAIGETGGVKDVTLTAAQSGLPAHKHTVKGYGSTANDATGGGRLVSGDSAAVPDDPTPALIDTSTTLAADAVESHENLPPYIVVYMWRRTA